MKRDQSYMTRALKARDPRFARVLGKLGYTTADLRAAETATKAKKVAKVQKAVTKTADDLRILRADYEAKLGKRPFHGWDAATLREKIAATSTED